MRKVAKHESEVPSMKRIGIIGGLGQWATLDIIERLMRASVLRVPQYGNRGYPPLNLRMLNRAPMLLNDDGSFPDVLKPSPELLEAAKFVGVNADFLIMPSNTPHLFAKEIEAAAGKPLLSMVDVTIEEVERRACKRVGVLAIGVTLKERLYQDPLEAKKVKSVGIPEELSRKLDEEGVWPLQEGAKARNVSAPAHEAVAYLREQKVDGIIIGCTEIPLLLGGVADDSDIINPSQLLAEAAVKKALGDNS